MAGHRVSDSCVPNSSILDTADAAQELQNTFDRPLKKSKRSIKRDSSDDTSKDISDIEDFDLDDINEDERKELKQEDDDTEHKNKNLSFNPKRNTFKKQLKKNSL